MTNQAGKRRLGLLSFAKNHQGLEAVTVGQLEGNTHWHARENQTQQRRQTATGAGPV